MTPTGPDTKVADVGPEGRSGVDRTDQPQTPPSSEQNTSARTRMTTPNTTEAAAPSGAGLSVRLEQLRAFYGQAEQVKGIDLEFQANRVTAIIGPSGCGKSTMIRCINRMHEEIPGARAEGRVMLEDTDLYGSSVDVVSVRRAIGMVFQKPNPFPTMSVFDNVAAGLRLSGRRGWRSEREGGDGAARREPVG